jgi:hypothetical protein
MNEQRLKLSQSTIDYLYPDKSDPKYKFFVFEEEIKDLTHRQKIPHADKIQSLVHFHNWLETNNDEDLDQALLWLTNNQNEIPEIFLNELKESAIHRLDNPKKKYLKSQIEAAKEDTLLIVARLIYFCEVKQIPAFEKGAWYYDQEYSHLSSFIATSIETKYRTWIKTSDGKRVIESFKKYQPNGWSKEEQEEYLSQFGEATKALKGTRD